ncbi:MAG: hypothetical protein ACEQSX_17950 [Baekduiaceae bacterium]
MGFLDGLLGRKKMVGPAPDRLFALTTAYVTLETGHQITTAGKAAIVFQPIDNADFDQIAQEMEALVRGTGEETGTSLTTTEDSFDYRWMVFSDPDVEDLVVGINAVNDALQVGGYGDRVLCAVFAFVDGRDRPLYLIYNVKRGAWYPFVPAGQNQRDSQREMQIKAILGTELPVEPELERWFPLWGIPI